VLAGILRVALRPQSGRKTPPADIQLRGNHDRPGGLGKPCREPVSDAGAGGPGDAAVLGPTGRLAAAGGGS